MVPGTEARAACDFDSGDALLLDKDAQVTGRRHGL